MTRTLTALSIFSLMTAISPAGAQDTARTIFGVDVSGSSTFLVDQSSADAAGAFVEKYIAALDPPHTLRMLSIGDEGLARRVIDIAATVIQNRASSAKKLGPQFGSYFRSLPSLVEAGKIAPQNTTSLIAFLEAMEPVCAAGNTTVIAFSDAIEWSATVDGQALIAGKATLPKPDRAYLKGCKIALLGVGQVKSALDGDGLAARLIPQWRTYLTEAGANPVTIISSGFSF